ncbi:MAG: AsmA family protein [Hyphomicrobium sp.]
MNHALAYLGGFLALVFAALFAAPAMIDWNGYRGIFEEEASKVLGRDVRVGGGVNLRLLPTPYVKFEKVRLADVSGQTGEPFIRVESFTMRLSGPALLRGVFEATEIELNKPVLTLALDGAGGGNWTTISLQPGALPFVPTNVTLRSVKLIDGALAVYSPDSAIVTKVEAINGELSADAIHGPYKFKGAAVWSGAAREFRFATTEMGKDGGIRIKAVTSAPATGNTFALDARIDNLATVPKLNGELTGTLLLPGANAKPVAKTTMGATGDAPPAMALRATMTADAGGASLSDMTLSLADAAEPQIITGTATATWKGAPRLDVAMTSKWLDFDRLAGAGRESAPFLKIKQFALGVISAVAGDGAAGAKINVEQVKIGGETAGGLKIDAERGDGVVRLKELRAGLPGGSRLGLFGDIKSTDAGALSFDGEGFVSGTSLARLKAWAEKSGAAIDIEQDGVFSAEGKVRIGGDRFELTEASAEIGGRPMTGEVKIIGEGRRRAEITVECARIESGDLFAQTTKTLDAAIRRAVGLGGEGAGDAGESQSQSGDDGMDIVLRMLAGELKHGSETYRDVDATVALEAGNVRVPSATFTTTGGLSVTVEGQVDDKDGVRSGTIAFDATGASKAAMRDLVRIFGADSIIAPERAEAIGSTKISGLVKLGARSAKSADVRLDGMLATSRMSLHGAFDEGLARWRSDPSQIRISIAAPSISELAATLGMAPKTASAQGGKSVAVRITTAGAVGAGAAARIDMTGAGFGIGYDGKLAWTADKPLETSGRLKVAADDINDILQIVGMGHSTGIGGGAKGTIDVAREDGQWKLLSQNLAIAGSAVKGVLMLATGADGAATVKGELEADHVTSAGLLSQFVEASPTTAAGASPDPATAADDAPPLAAWPQGRFNLGVLDRISGDVDLAFTRLTVSEGMDVRSGSMTISMAPGKLGFNKIAGAAAGGKLHGDIELQASPSGIAGKAKLALSAMDLSNLGASGQGKADVVVSLSGQALSPAALIASLAGEGKAKLERARIVGPTNVAARDVIESVLQGKTANEPESVALALKTALSSTVVDLGDRTIDYKVVNGVASIAPMTLEDDAGSSSATASLDLGSWSVTSLWKVAPRIAPLAAMEAAPPGWKPPAPKGPLPAASIAIEGRMGDLGAAVASVEAGSLQRELAVRQMERNVEELERLRYMDEERARIEKERRKALEEQRAQAAAEARARRASDQQTAPVAPPAVGAPAVQPAPVAPSSQAPTPQSAAPPAQGEAAAPPSPPGADGPPASGDTQAANSGAKPATGTAVPAASVGDPTLEGSQRSVSRPRPERPAAPRRSPNDEVMRSLGAIP